MRVLFALMVVMFLPVPIATASDHPIRPTPLIRAVDPEGGKCGAELIATGDYLGKTVVKSLYLTLGQATFQVEILKQADTSITFKVPDRVKPGRMGLMVLTTGLDPEYIDEPASITVE